MPCSAAYFRTSSIIFMLQKCGPYTEQKCAVSAPSRGRISSRNSRTFKKHGYAGMRNNFFAFSYSNLRSIFVFGASRRIAAMVCAPWQPGPRPMVSTQSLP